MDLMKHLKVISSNLDEIHFMFSSVITIVTSAPATVKYKICHPLILMHHLLYGRTYVEFLFSLISLHWASLTATVKSRC